MVLDFLDNAFFRNIYCNLSSSDGGVDGRCAGRVFSILPDGVEWLAFLVSGASISLVLLNAMLGPVFVVIGAEVRLLVGLRGGL